MSASLPNRRIIKAPSGPKLNARSWQTEGPLRLLMNNLDPEVAERPEDLVVYGGRGKAARDWPSFDRIVAELKTLADDETLLVQSGKPVGIIQTHEDAPRVLIANSNLVGKWATAEHFDELERRGLMMYGQMTAGSWSYIGSQGIIGGTFETFVEAGRQHCGGDLAGRWILSAGLGGMGGAQPLAAVLAGASMLVVEARAEPIERRLKAGYLDRVAATLDEALSLIEEARQRKDAVSIALRGNAVEIYEELLARNTIPDIVTDQTAAHDPLHGFLPAGWTIDQWERTRETDPEAVIATAKASMARHVRSMLAFKKRGVAVFDYGNNIRQMARDAGVEEAFDFPGFIAAYIRPQFCRGRAQFRWVALSGDPEDIYKTAARMKEVVTEDPALSRWLDMTNERVRFQGLPARSCWLGLENRVRAGCAINEMVARGELAAPIVIGRDHISSGSVASPNRESEGMLDGSDAVADWPLLNGLISCASGATWVSIHHGGGVGIGYSQHAGLAVVCDGSEAAGRRVERVLRNDASIAVFRHADAGYPEAIATVRRDGLRSPFLSGARGASRSRAHGRKQVPPGENAMIHQRLRRFNTRDTYPEQKLDNDLCQVVKARGTMVFLRGQIGQDLETRESVGIGDAAAQAEQAMQNIAMLLKEAGGSVEHICKVTIYITDPRYREQVYRVIGKHLKGVFPVSTGIVISALARPEWVVEVDAIAVIPD